MGTILMLKEILYRVLGHKPPEISIDMALTIYDKTGRDQPCLDLSSLETIEFIAYIEDYCDVVIDWDVEFGTIGDIVNYVNDLKERREIESI